MSLVINTNSIATMTRNYLTENQANLQRSLGRLASGSRIVRPSDDAGGLAVGNKITATVNRNIRGQQNVSNAVSFLQVQDGALSTVGKILDRMSELKTMSLDVTKNSLDIANYDAEFSQLQQQLSNVRDEKFNGISLFGKTASSSVDGVLNKGNASFLGGDSVSKNYTTFSRTHTTHTSGDSTLGSISINVINFYFSIWPRKYPLRIGNSIRIGRSATSSYR